MKTCSNSDLVSEELLNLGSSAPILSGNLSRILQRNSEKYLVENLWIEKHSLHLAIYWNPDSTTLLKYLLYTITILFLSEVMVAGTFKRERKIHFSPSNEIQAIFHIRMWRYKATTKGSNCFRTPGIQHKPKLKTMKTFQAVTCYPQNASDA